MLLLSCSTSSDDTTAYLKKITMPGVLQDRDLGNRRFHNANTPENVISFSLA
jgi:hypothetical protein